MGKSIREPWVNQSSTYGKMVYNHKVRHHNKLSFRSWVANGMIGLEPPFETKNIMSDYKYCESRSYSDELKETRK
jgi:hypothetical protein